MRDPQVDELLAPLRENPPDAAGRSEIDRERVVARMIAVAKIEPRGWARRKFPVLAIAAGFALALGAVLFRSRHVATTASSVVVTAVAGDVTWQGAKAIGIAPGQSATVDALGDLVTAPSGQAHLLADNGLELDVFGDTRISLAEMRGPSGAVRLLGGKVRCRVPHLASKETFSVVASDVRVLVHGTVFSVEVAPGGEPRAITVRVDEGVVLVHHRTGHVTLTDSESWTNQTSSYPAALPTEPPDAQASKDSTPKESPAPALSRRTGGPPRPPSGTLDEETRLLRSGLAAERSGDLADAADSFEQLLSHFPQSPLEPDARAALRRIRSRQKHVP